MRLHAILCCVGCVNLLSLGGLLGDVFAGVLLVFLAMKKFSNLGCNGSSSFFFFLLSLCSFSDVFGPRFPVWGAAAPPPSTW